MTESDGELYMEHLNSEVQPVAGIKGVRRNGAIDVVFIQYCVP
ncbi:MAG: hypothetical protein ACK5O2_02325 [Microthrixaceae bacterium]